MNAIELVNPITSIAEGLIRGLGIGGLIVGIVAAIGFFMIVIGLLGYTIITIADVAEAAKDRAADVAAEGIRAARARREE